MNNTITLFSTAYLGNIYYYSKYIQSEAPLIEMHEHFCKQTFRNRCQILTANGVLNLSVPVKKISGTKQLITEIAIDYSENWQKQHWNAIVSAYNSSPFFLHYDYLFESFYIQQYKTLFELNCELHKTVLQCLKVNADIAYTSDFIPLDTLEEDFRYIISPKVKLQDTFIEYYQTFKEKYDFIENLSIIDLLFNEGPNTKSILSAR